MHHIKSQQGGGNAVRQPGNEVQRLWQQEYGTVSQAIQGKNDQRFCIQGGGSGAGLPALCEILISESCQLLMQWTFATAKMNLRHSRISYIVGFVIFVIGSGLGPLLFLFIDYRFPLFLI